ncbi:homeobox domain-containing protein, partial [Entophlyctis helioformis]
KPRSKTNPEQAEVLIQAFAKNALPDAAQREELAERTGLSARSVQIWFQNRRAKVR